MAYVDLNPVRAGIARTPEESIFTSIYARIQALRPTPIQGSAAMIPAKRLLAFSDQACANQPAIPATLLDYVQLLDWSGRQARHDKHGAIGEHAPPILVRLNIDPGAWKQAMQIKGNVFGRALGRLDHLRLHARAIRQARIQGSAFAQRLFGRQSSSLRPTLERR